MIPRHRRFAPALLLGCVAFLGHGIASATATQPDRDAKFFREQMLQLFGQVRDYRERKEVMPAARVHEYVRHFVGLAAEPMPAQSRDVLTGFNRLHAMMRSAELDVEGRREVARTLLSSPNDELRRLAGGLQRVLDLYHTPLELKLTTLEGEPLDIADWRGKVVLIDLWSTSCSSCVSAMPALKALHERHHPEGFEMVAISLDALKNLEQVRTILQQQRAPWVNALEPWESTLLRERFGLTFVPVYLLLDRDGRLVGTDYSGADGRERLESEVRRLLGSG